MFRIQRISNSDITLVIVGQLQADGIGELSALLAREDPARSVALDLKDLSLADLQVVRFLKECEARGIALRNCPVYIRTWIAAQTVT